jgi:PAS domain S-box-containing protein
MTDILGYSPEELRELTYRDVIHPHDRLVREGLNQALDGTETTASSQPTVVRNIRKDGVTIWISLNVAAVRSESGQIRNYVTQVADVTEQRLADERLENTRAQLDQAQEIGSIGTWIYWLKPGEERLVCSSGELKILGLPAGFSGSLASLGGLVHPDDLESAQQAYDTALREGGSEARHRLIRPDGDVRWIHQKLALIRDQRGAPSHVLGVTQDVTGEYLSELSAKQDREMLSKVLNNSPVVLFAVDRDGTPTLAEGKVLTTFGLTPEQARSLNVFDLFANTPEALHHIRAALSGESFAGEVELPGLGLCFDSRYEPMYDQQGLVVGLSGIATDITERIQAKRAREDSESKARIAAMMNHEVRTPLNSVLGFAELLNIEKVGPLNPTQKRYVSNIETAGRHLLSLINESLDLAKLAAGQMAVELDVVAVAPVLSDVTARVEPMVDFRELQLRLVAPPGLQVRADRRHLIQVLYNLLSNAIKHSPKGGVITLGASREGGSVLISVKDEGGGIAAVDLDRIFIEFVTLNSGAEGTGLGLTISRKLAELMGGTLTVTSEVGVGSVFTLTLPAADAAEPPETGPAH